jgi:hypothetical protein
MTVSESDPEGRARVDALRQALDQFGWAEAKNHTMARSAQGDRAHHHPHGVSLQSGYRAFPCELPALV